MPITAADQPPSRRRLALPLTAGAALWAFAHYLLALPGAHDTAGIQTWALATSWVISTAGAALALVCTYLLARRLEIHLTSRDRTPQPPQPASSGRRRWSSATILIAVGAAVTALSQLLWVFVGPLPSWAFTLVDIVGGVVAPAALTLGIYLALRRLEDHLAGYHRGRAPKAPDAGGQRHASGLTSPYVIS
ncbi:hypothetical protein WDZ17_14390 [Pseudokineococcus basanitobsidens]|uniref:Uncharacterized protein n=1 Tax=Pseudokineococcus basanitobsidens TaxID=1926649 RepID=A0ABU8RN89_9ACTN